MMQESSEKYQYHAVKLRCYPTKEQQQMLPQLFGNTRFVYNYFLNYQQWRYHHGLKHLSNFDTQKLLTKLKRKSKYQFLKLSDSTSLQVTLNNLEEAYQRFFKHVNNAGRPKFKRFSYNQSYTGKNITNSIKILSRHHIKFNKLGDVLVEGNVKRSSQIVRATIRITSQNHYYLVLLIKSIKPNLKKTKRSIGIDMGLRNIVNLSNGRKYRSLKFSSLDRKIVIANRKLEKRINNAKIQVEREINMHKNDLIPYNPVPWYARKRVVEARKFLAKLYDKKANYRKDFLQKLSTQLIKQYDVIVIEDLKPQNMMKNHHLAKAIGEQGWRMFRDMLQYKCAWYGKQLVIISPKYTTQICSNCHYKMGSDNTSKKLELGVENWTCPNCHVHHDRDHNAATNILNQGLSTTLATEINS